MTKEDRMHDYFELRSWGESPEDAALRKRLSETDASEFEASFRQAREGRAAA